MKCQWPLHARPETLEDGALYADRWKCGRPTIANRPYCVEHEALAFRNPARPEGEEGEESEEAAYA